MLKIKYPYPQRTVSCCTRPYPSLCVLRFFSSSTSFSFYSLVHLGANYCLHLHCFLNIISSFFLSYSHSTWLNSLKSMCDSYLTKIGYTVLAEIKFNLFITFVQFLKSQNKREVDYLKHLQVKLNVSLDDYLSSTIKKANKIIEINQSGKSMNGGENSNIHFHNNN